MHFYFPFRANWLKIHGQLYKPSCAVVIGGNDAEYPQFGKVKAIYIVDSKGILEVKQYKNISFCNHYHAYQVEDTSSLSLVSVTDLVVPYPELVRTIDSAQYIVIKHHICNTL